jgi:hypothetical protein
MFHNASRKGKWARLSRSDRGAARLTAKPVCAQTSVFVLGGENDDRWRENPHRCDRALTSSSGRIDTRHGPPRETTAVMRHIAMLTIGLSSLAAAEPYSVGVRVGGYGFHREGDQSANAWTQCRMNGLGVFAQRALRGPLFVEAGLDAYASLNRPAANDLPIDRQSGLISVAAGARSSFTSWLTGYVQLGAGLELARVAVPYGDAGTIRANKAMPDGFFGAGADIRIGSATVFGASLRMLAMGNFSYDPAQLKMSNMWVTPPTPDRVFDASPGFATQGQFYIRRDL